MPALSARIVPPAASQHPCAGGELFEGGVGDGEAKVMTRHDGDADVGRVNGRSEEVALRRRGFGRAARFVELLLLGLFRFGDVAGRWRA